MVKARAAEPKSNVDAQRTSRLEAEQMKASQLLATCRRHAASTSGRAETTQVTQVVAIASPVSALRNGAPLPARGAAAKRPLKLARPAGVVTAYAPPPDTSPEAVKESADAALAAAAEAAAAAADAGRKRARAAAEGMADALIKNYGAEGGAPPPVRLCRSEAEPDVTIAEIEVRDRIGIASGSHRDRPA